MTPYCTLIANQGPRNDHAASLSPDSDDNGQSGQRRCFDMSGVTGKVFGRVI